GEPGTLIDFDTIQIIVQSVGGDDRTAVWDGGAAARYLPSGHLVYAQGTALFAARFDPEARAFLSTPVPMVQGVRRSPSGMTDTANFAISDTGTLVSIPGGTSPVVNEGIETTVTWVDRDGNEEPLPAVRPDDYTMARISPDGTKIA